MPSSWSFDRSEFSKMSAFAHVPPWSLQPSPAPCACSTAPKPALALCLRQPPRLQSRWLGAGSARDLQRRSRCRRQSSFRAPPQPLAAEAATLKTLAPASKPGSSLDPSSLGPLQESSQLPKWPPALNADETAHAQPPSWLIKLAHHFGLDPRPSDANQSFTAEDARDLRLGARYLRAYLWPRGDPRTRARVALACLSLVAANALNAAVPLIFKRIAERAAAPGAAVPVALVSALFAARSGAALASAARYVGMQAVGQRAIRQVSVDVFGHLHALDARFHVERSTGAVARLIDRGARAIERLICVGVSHFGRAFIEGSIILGILTSSYGWQYAAASLLWLALYSAWTVTLTRWRTPLRHVINELDDRQSARLVDSLLNYETVKYFGQEEAETRGYESILRELEHSNVLGIKSINLLGFGQAAICAAAVCSALALACARRMGVGDLVAINGLTIQLYAPLEHLGYAFRELKASTTDLRRLVELADTRPAVTDAPAARQLAACRGAVEFRDVTFGYGPGRRELRGVSFRVEPGRTLAIVGPTGSGKSTVLRLLFRSYDPDSGAVLVDGEDVRGVAAASLRRQMGVVPQDAVLFNDSLYRNLRFARPDASPEEVLAAARAARLDETVQRFPHKYGTRVGERGVRLSGGEKQRLAIARVLLKDPPILLLDEATSALDSATERDVLRALRALSRGRTTIVVAHRLSTVVDADAILVLEAGRVAEQGTHAELLARPAGRYAAMWRTQLKEPAAGEAHGRAAAAGAEA